MVIYKEGFYIKKCPLNSMKVSGIVSRKKNVHIWCKKLLLEYVMLYSSATNF
jgi:hypothetical protein